MAGCPAQGMEIVKQHVLAEYARGKATLIGEPERASAEGAALFNGTLSHWEEY